MKERYIGYVLNSIDYKDSDSLLSVLCEDGVICLRARGVKKVNSRNASSVMNYAYSEFEVNRSSKNNYLTLCEGKLINYPSFICERLDYISAINLISEGIDFIEDKSDSFKLFVDCLEKMKEKEDCALIVISFLNYFLEKQGCELNSDGCVSCGRKVNIVKFSFNDGGYLCGDCCNCVKDDIEYLKNVRILTKTNYDNMDKVNIDYLYKYKYIKEVLDFVENKAGIYFKSKKFLLMILKGEEENERI